MIWIILLAPFLFILGVLIRDANIDPTKFWKPFGVFVMVLGILVFVGIFILMTIGAIISI